MSNNQPSSDINEWQGKLVGKTLTENAAASQQQPAQTFNKRKLLESTRVIGPDTMATMDFRPERLNVHVDKDNTVHHVHYG